MNKAGIAVILAVCLLTLSAVSIADDSDADSGSDAESGYEVFGYVNYGGRKTLFHEEGATAIITKATPDDGGGVDYVEFKSDGILEGKFTIRGVDFSYGSDYYLRIESTNYQIECIPLMDPQIIDGYEFETVKIEKEGEKVEYRNLGYRIDILKAVGAQEDNKILITGEKETGPTIPMAQKETVKLTGTISSGDFKIIGAKLELIHDKEDYHGEIPTTHTDKYGKYTLEAIPGEYTLKISADGYKTKQIKDVPLDGNLRLDVDDLEKSDEIPLPRTLMIVAGIIGVIILIASVVYRMRLKKHPHKSIVYDDDAD